MGMSFKIGNRVKYNQVKKNYLPGTRPLVVQDVVTSCGCLTVDYPREPVRPGGEAALRLTYKADNPGYFRKTVTVYANAEEAPLRVQVSGNAE